MLRVVNFISGGGSTNLAVISAEKPGGKLHGLVETVAIVSSDPKADGIEKAWDAGFPISNVWVARPNDGNFTSQLLKILDRYQPDYFHQLGWMPLTPKKVINRYKGLNQHLGPGGKWMYGVRRIYAHMLFCEMIWDNRPIPIFCQFVAPKYDKGNAICVYYENILPGESPENAAARLLPFEHQVQIEGLYRLATNSFEPRPVPEIALNRREEEILLEAKKKARDIYPPAH